MPGLAAGNWRARCCSHCDSREEAGHAGATTAPGELIRGSLKRAHYPAPCGPMARSGVFGAKVKIAKTVVCQVRAAAPGIQLPAQRTAAAAPDAPGHGDAAHRDLTSAERASRFNCADPVVRPSAAVRAERSGSRGTHAREARRRRERGRPEPAIASPAAPTTAPGTLAHRSRFGRRPVAHESAQGRCRVSGRGQCDCFIAHIGKAQRYVTARAPVERDLTPAERAGAVIQHGESG